MMLRERVLARINVLVEQGDVPHDVLAPHLGVGQSAVSKILNGRRGLSLEAIDGFCVFFQITPAELMAEPDALIQPLKPIEAAIVALVRQMTELERRSLLTLLERPVYQVAKGKRARMGRAMLTAKEQELVDLFARVKRDGVREGVLQTLRGAVRDGATVDSRHTTG